jgi:hypothetical protein
VPCCLGLRPDGGGDERALRPRRAVFLATFHHDPALLDPVRAVIADMRRRVAEDGLPPGIGGVVMAAGTAVHGPIFGMYNPTPAEMDAMHATLSRLIEEATP